MTYPSLLAAIRHGDQPKKNPGFDVGTTSLCCPRGAAGAGNCNLDRKHETWGGSFIGKGRSIVAKTSKPVLGFDTGDDSAECSRCKYYILSWTVCYVAEARVPLIGCLVPESSKPKL